MADEIKLTLEPFEDENKKELDSAVQAAQQATEALEKAFYALSEKLYRQNGGNGENGGNDGNGGTTTDGNGNFYSSDFEDQSGQNN